MTPQAAFRAAMDDEGRAWGEDFGRAARPDAYQAALSRVRALVDEYEHAGMVSPAVASELLAAIDESCCGESEDEGDPA